MVRLVVDSADPQKLADLSAQAFDYRIMFSSGDEVALARDEHVRWVVMADPEGNEFYVLTPHPEQV